MSENGENGEISVSQSSESARAGKNQGSKKVGRPVGRTNTERANKPLPDIHSFGLIECPNTVIERVDYIADVMAACAWETGKTGKVLAKHWGLSVSTVEGYSAEASRLIVADPTTWKRELATGAAKLYRQAIANGDARSAKMMADVLSEVTGAAAPTKQEIAHTIGEATPKTARDVMADVFKGDIGAGAREDTGPVPVPVPVADSSALADPESE